MKLQLLLAVGLCVCSATSVHAAEPPPAESDAVDNAELRTLFDQDQNDRTAQEFDWVAINARDTARRQRVDELLRSGQIRTANDYRHAAFVFQHGDDAAAYRLAHALATLAMTLDDSQQNRWIVAASWDRLLMSQLQPQWYGTQHKGDARGMYLYPVAADAVSDKERQRMIGITLDEVRTRGMQRATDSGLKIRQPAPTIDELRAEANAAKPKD
ncbi:MAG: hypothetical protein Q4G62_09285 [Pseudomonadota bacterium]|nr:hypothetical protein [Pseudomonadota bacterium]